MPLPPQLAGLAPLPTTTTTLLLNTAVQNTPVERPPVHTVHSVQNTPVERPPVHTVQSVQNVIVERPPVHSVQNTPVERPPVHTVQSVQNVIVERPPVHTVQSVQNVIVERPPVHTVQNAGSSSSFVPERKQILDTIPPCISNFSPTRQYWDTAPVAGRGVSLPAPWGSGPCRSLPFLLASSLPSTKLDAEPNTPVERPPVHTVHKNERRGRARLRLLLTSLLSLSILLAYNWLPATSQAPVAFAHAFVIGSNPVDGSTVNVTPTVVRIFFNEPLGPASIAHVFAPDGHLVEASRSSIPSTNTHELDTPLMTPSSLPQGSYTVRWTGLSTDDGHTTHGVIGFNIGQSSVGLPGETILGPSTSNILPHLDLFAGLSIAWDWLVLVALTFWVGILVMEGLVLARFGGGQTSPLMMRARNRSVPLQWLCLAALLVGEIITLVLRATLLTQTLGSGGFALLAFSQLLLGTNYGHLWLTRAVLVGVALVLLWRTTRTKVEEPVGTREEHRHGGDVDVQTSAVIRGRHPHDRPFARLRRQVAQAHGVDLPTEAVSPRGSDREQNSLGGFGEPLPSPSGGATSTWYTIVWLTLASLILLTIAPMGDAAQLAQPHISAIVLSWLYLVAQCMWFGMLAYVGYVLLPLLPIADPNHHAGRLALLLRHLTPVIVGTLGVLLVSGLFLGESSVSNVHQLLSDAYGRALLVKTILIALMLMLSAYTLFIIRPKLARQALSLHVVDAELPARRTRQSAMGRTEEGLRLSLRVLSWLGAGVLLCAALMTFYAPPIVFPAITYAPNTTSPATSVVNAQTQQVGELAVTLQVLPGRVDYTNTVVVTIQDGRGKPVTDAQVQLITNMELMDMGTAHATVAGGNPTYIATFDKGRAFSMPGLWDIAVRIQRPNAAAVQTLFKVTFAG